jgi:hypothetical protein
MAGSALAVPGALAWVMCMTTEPRPGLADGGSGDHPDASGRYFASFVVQTTDGALPPVESEAGIDLGLTHFAVFSDGTVVAAPKFLRRADRKLKRL